MKCEKPFDIVDYLKGELAASERPSAQAHFDSCEDCKKDVTKVDVMLKSLGKLKTEKIEPSSDMRWRVRAAFVEAHPEFLERTLQPSSREPKGLWATMKERLGYVPAWAISVAVHVVLLAIATVVFFAPRKAADVWEEGLISATPKTLPKVPEFTPPGLGDFKPKTPADIDQPPIDWEVQPRDPKSPIRPDGRRFSDKPFEGPKWSPQIKENRFGKLGDGRGAGRTALARKFGAGAAGKSVDLSLDWLARQQEEDGHWDASKFGGKREFNVGVTGLVVLAFLGNGETPEAGAHAPKVKKGVAWLTQQQRRDGIIGAITANTMYNHGVAALALIECYLLTKDESLKLSVEAAVAYTMHAQNDQGGWGYTARSDESDTSVGGWQILVLRMALATGNSSVIPALNAARDRLNLMTDGEGRVGYRARSQFPNGPYGLTAVGMFANVMASPIPDKAALEKQAGVLMEGWREHPVSVGASGSNDLYYWYFASLALFQFGDPSWEQWNKSLTPALMRAQGADGSWGATYDRWSIYGGQLYTTAMGTLILETCWRYPRLME